MNKVYNYYPRHVGGHCRLICLFVCLFVISEPAHLAATAPMDSLHTTRY